MFPILGCNQLEMSLVLFEEAGGDPTLLSGFRIPVDMWTEDEDTRKPTLSLGFPSPNQVIWSLWKLHPQSMQQQTGVSIVEKACMGSRSCSIGVSVNTFGAGTTKTLAVEASCT